jgi:nuclear pore complex protein Nup188
MGWICVLNGIWELVEMNTVWGDEGAVSQASDVVEFYRSLLPELFPTSVEAGLKKMASTSAGTMLDITTVLLEPSEGASSFDLRSQEDGSRMRNVLANLIQNTIGFFDISVGLIVATFLVTDVEYNELGTFNGFLAQENVGQQNCCPEWIGSPARNLLHDPNARNLLVRVKNRFPYEPLPLLQLLRGFSTESSDIIEFLSRVNTYTQQLPHGFRDYDDIGEEDAGQIELASDLVLFPPREDGLFELGHHTSNFSSLGGIAVREGTRGVQASGAGAKQVVTWQCDYNALSFFGRILECALLPDHDAVKRDLCTPGVVTEIVVLLTGLIASSKEAKAARARVPGHYEVPRVLEEASDMLGRNRDIVSVVFDLLDKALNHYAAPNPLFAAGLEFVDSLVHVVPGRVWPYLARSTLLERRGHGGAFSGIISAVEVVQGSYEVTLAALTLFESLVDEAIRGSAVHKGRSRGLVVSSKAPPPVTGTAGSGVSDIVQRDILLGFTRVIVDIFESYRGFKYTRDISQKLHIGSKIAKIFTTILDDVYGIDEFSEAEAKITSVLGPSAEYLVSVFLGEGTSELSLEPIVGAISDGISTPETSLYLTNLASWLEQVVHIVKFADVLVRVRLYTGYVS